MFVTTLDSLKAAGKQEDYCDGMLRSIDFLLKDDGMGFTISDVRCTAGLDEVLWYKHHWEANLILEGQGMVSKLGTGESWPLQSGSIYIVGPEDRHSIEAAADLHIISIFNPPLQGDEQHDHEGSLPPSGPLPPGFGNGAE